MELFAFIAAILAMMGLFIISFTAIANESFNISDKTVSIFLAFGGALFATFTVILFILYLLSHF